MTQDNKIWHTPDEQPGYFPAQLVAELENGFLFYFECNSLATICNDWFYLLDNIECETMCPIRRWAYLKTFIASSKALDVAIDALKRLRDVPDEDNDQWFNYCCPRCVLQEINEIMKSLQ